MTDVRRPLPIAGLTPLSTVDLPGSLVATVFLQGCPWRCGYCHNPALIDARTPGVVAWSDVAALLRRRRGLLDGVVFSGGEPTMHRGLLDAIDDVRALGMSVGLHTGGAWPARLARLLPFVDWVGLDIKHLAGRYTSVTGAGPSGARAFESLAVLQHAGIAHEVRTTVDPTVHTRDDVLALGARLRACGVRDWVLQEARPDGTTDRYTRALAGRRLDDVLRPEDLPGVERRCGA
ncbi:anaerobic ribonucleoside-triphosphate reductase activating protein [Paraoerskovia sediminicola]|uniref:Anaerobic ribonucleoside-triphosphate reductase activating protein n=1 Tax=Paraoerskovia sediminicola TaxID=1138587 RepID=A0ABN6XA42_9CELL|nr:anaerobic ribonucleoside-triphosphate reductase activating protein [Paraoerskovia sediminicola]BDZ41743.1 anaerobic ribonucleoside-triphosphate reductase activating protein [Paraoerskovia sediminicola]